MKRLDCTIERKSAHTDVGDLNVGEFFHLANLDDDACYEVYLVTDVRYTNLRECVDVRTGRSRRIHANVEGVALDIQVPLRFKER